MIVGGEKRPGSSRDRVISVVVGTRPEAIKMAPLILSLRRREWRVHLLATGQHTDMLLEPLRFFGLEPDDNLGIMRERQTLDHITSSVLVEVGKVLDRVRPDMVLVHGDTTTTFASSLAAFYRRIPVGHVEAGLRSRNLQLPFPEELNRVFADRLSTLWFPPTEGARTNLLAEGCDATRIHVTGNTVIDALREGLRRVREPRTDCFRRIPRNKRILLLTAHRRESWGEGLKRIAEAVRQILDARDDCVCLVPMHRNPEVRETLQQLLGGRKDVVLCDALPYPDFLWAMRECYLILSDSGGVQEEATAISKPVLVLRSVTERPEAVEAGTAILVGTETDTIVEQASRLLGSEAEYQRVAEGRENTFGDGRASERIVEVIEQFFLETTPFGR